jgi:prepilin-type N-terminal cleavage/methylation domain-containing protein
MRHKGYSLIEILVVLAVLGILFAAGYANFRDFTRRQAISNSAKEVMGDLRQAQQMALSGQKPANANCIGVYVLNGFNFRVVSSTQYEIRPNCSGPNPPPVTKTVTLPAGVIIASPYPNPNPILFKVLGAGTNIGNSTTLNLRQSVSGATQIITITSGGRVQ